MTMTNNPFEQMYEVVAADIIEAFKIWEGKMYPHAKSWFLIGACLLAVGCIPPAAAGFDEGTRHITGSGADIYFMNDKVFGTAAGRPLWAIYNCGESINGTRHWRCL